MIIELIVNYSVSNFSIGGTGNLYHGASLLFIGFAGHPLVDRFGWLRSLSVFAPVVSPTRLRACDCESRRQLSLFGQANRSCIAI
jgi:hypothetical protein